jgi:hypothetical protein
MEVGVDQIMTGSTLLQSLTLRGGGRGIIPTVVLTALEAKLQALTFSGQLFQSFNNGVGPHVNLVSN